MFILQKRYKESILSEIKKAAIHSESNAYLSGVLDGAVFILDAYKESGSRDATLLLRHLKEFNAERNNSNSSNNSGITSISNKYK